MIEQLDKNELLAMLHKRCSKCGVVKYFGEFIKHRTSACGVSSRCKACDAEYRRKYYEENKEKYAGRHRKYYEENKEKKAEYRRKHYEENKWKYAERVSEYHRDNPDKLAERARKRRARKANAAGTHTAEQVKARFDYYGNKCIYCGSGESLEIEHRIPLSRGGSDWPANLAPACRPCNRSKGTKTEAEFKKILEERNE